ncbi:DEKNAAC102592 [Brettanomyces naardenensis]|uniref:Succinate dehydrogenase [ubiquinone] cytochrome b small subunit n=1 Tax=Brettanomyces naardenensis TaxID=13370 RepID=A0A448YLC8_BRENA|nr:DEKNAAC102592 [Brettanomyces naardenensis]
MLTRLGLSVRPALAPVLRSTIRPTSQIAYRSLFIKTIPQPPGNIIGTVNDAYATPPPKVFAGSRHWTFERLVTIGLTPLVVAPFITGTSSAPIDAVMSSLLLYHCFAGFENCIADYIPARVFGVWHSAALGLLFFGTVIAGYGIYVIETTNNEGLFGLFKKIWTKQKN